MRCTLLHGTPRLLHRNCRHFHQCPSSSRPRRRADQGRFPEETGAFRLRVSSKAELSTEDLPSSGEILKAVGSAFDMPQLPRVLRPVLSSAEKDSQVPASLCGQGPAWVPREREGIVTHVVVLSDYVPIEEIRCRLSERSARRKAKHVRPTFGRWTIPTTPPHTPRSPRSDRRCLLF